MAVRHAEANWQGTLKEGGGRLKLGSGVYSGPYTWASRFATGPDTNPEELLGAAHAACYTMFLSAVLTREGFTPGNLETEATIHLEDGPTITKIVLDVEAAVPDVSEEQFQALVTEAKENCPVSKALAGGPDIVVNATLQS